MNYVGQFIHRPRARPMLRLKLVLLSVLLVNPTGSLAQQQASNSLRGEWRFLVPFMRLGLPPLPRCRLGAIQDFRVHFRQTRSGGGFAFELSYDQDPSNLFHGRGSVSGNSFSMTLAPTGARLRGVMEKDVTESGDDVTTIVGTMHCGSDASEFRLVRDDPNRKPATMAWGTRDYYLFRERDFRLRHPTETPPAYYRDFGARYVHRLRVEIRGELSAEGVRFVDAVAVGLQQVLEATLLTNPAGYDALERSPLFAHYAFASHIFVYCNAGWERLPEHDRDLIISSIDWLDKYSSGPMHPQLATAGLIGLQCGHFQDVVPDWPWIPEWESIHRSIQELLDY